MRKEPLSAIARMMQGPMTKPPAPKGATVPPVRVGHMAKVRPVRVDGLADPDEPGITAKQRANRVAYIKLKQEREAQTKVCPFCRHDDVQIDEISPGRFAVICQECECVGPVSDVSVQGAIMQWNIRHG